MIVLIDMDGVIVDLVNPILEMYNDEYNDNLTEKDITDYYFHRCVKPECGYKIYNYFGVPGLWERLPAYPGALEYLERLFIENKHQYYIVTQPPTDVPEGMTGKYKWLKNNAPFIPEDRYFFCTHKHLVKGDAILEDRPETLRSWPGCTVAMSRPYNVNTMANYTVSDWEEFYSLINRVRL